VGTRGRRPIPATSLTIIIDVQPAVWTVITDILGSPVLGSALPRFGPCRLARSLDDQGLAERSDLENTFRILASALGIIVGFAIVSNALQNGIDFSSLTTGSAAQAHLLARRGPAQAADHECPVRCLDVPQWACP
jgi:hypothetical protein